MNKYKLKFNGESKNPFNWQQYLYLFLAFKEILFVKFGF